MTPDIRYSQVFPTLLVGDIAAAVDFYVNRLGFRERFTWGEPPTYAGVDLGNTTLHLQQGTARASWHVPVSFIIDDADALFAFQVANGVEVTVPPDDRPYGIRDYSVKDPYGNNIAFGHYIYNQGPPLKIERVDVPVRLEKRLAALLAELAAHKKMSIGSCLEETLLHTFERVGDSVASPHTLSTLQYIEELKKKHGIDYDTHASYRFEE